MSAYSDRIVADGASHYWRLGETAGTTAADSVGAAPGTISGGVTLGQPAALADGNPAMTFDGATGKIVTAPVTLVTPFTIELWARRASDVGVQVLFCNSWSVGDNCVWYVAGGVLNFYTGVAGPSAPLPLDTGWHHLVVVCAGGIEGRIYVDGSLTISDLTPITFSAGSSKAIEIGFDPNWNYYNGSLDEVAIYPSALTPVQIAAHYTLATSIPWALGPGEKALMQARSGIARSGATRSNYYQGAAVITIDNGSGPIDITSHVVYNGWSLSLNLNDEVDTASVSLLPSCPFVPIPHSPIKIGLGAIGNLEFAGIVLTVQRTRRPGPDPRFWYDLTCIDWTAILDAHLIVAEYPQQSVTTTILDIIARFTRGGISTAGVPANLPSVPGFTVIHERPSTVLRRITNKLGGGFYLDANRVLRAWSSTIPSPLQEPAPVPLTDHLSTLHTFRMTEDASQQRTRVFVEGQRTSTLLAVQEGIDWQTQYLAVALQEGGIFPVPGEQLGQIDYMRIDNQFSDVPQGVSNPALDGSSNPPGTVLTEDAPIGATYIMVADATAFPLSGVAQAAGQLVFYIKGADTVLNLYIATGFPGVRAPITAGTQIIAIPYVTFHPVDRSPTPGLLFEKTLTRMQPQGAAAVTLASMEDAGIAATIGAREGSDGFYEHLVQDGRFNQAGCRARAQAELADFSLPLLTYEWETDDLNAQPGRMQHIALTEGTPITADVRITNVTVTPLVSGRPPRRQVKATKVQTAGVVDVWVDDTR